MNWLLHSTAGTLTRVVIGCGILLTLMIVDLARNKSRATRWREYVFLLICVAVAIMYGMLNDQVTSRISWEYFYYGKELYEILGPQVPPDQLALSREAAKIGAMATWSVGLILGVAILIANNPRRDRPQLRFRALLKLLIPVIAITIVFAMGFGFAGSRGWLNRFGAEFQELWDTNLWRPRRFMTAWGAHLGGYAGGLIGGAWCVWRTWRLRKRATPTTSI
ncbi:MAG: hypothetical protein H7Z14_00875 [Anaerolineae bacterium]|nr:hypothetical protein [Phycisphaerae bacterium]